MRKLIFSVVCSGLLVACGGGGGGGGFKDPDSVNFTYGTPTAAAGSALSAAESASEGLAATVAIQEQGAADDELAADVANLPTALAGLLWSVPIPSGSAGPIAAARDLSMSRRAVALAQGNLAAVTESLPPACVTITATQVIFSGCSESMSEGGMDITLTLNGTLTRGIGHVDWDVTLRMSEVGLIDGHSVSATISEHLTGDVTVTAGAIQGFEQVDLGITGAVDGQSDGLKVTYRVDTDLTYLADPAFCLTGGTVTGKVVWTQRPQGEDSTSLPDAAVQLTWVDNAGACSDSVLVAWGTPD